MEQPENYLDCRGKLCPVPLLETRRALEMMPAGSLTVIVDRLAAKENITRVVVEAGHQVLCEERESEWVLTITKACPDPLPGAAQEPPGSVAGPTVVLIADRGLGRSDADLGKILMKAFLTTLAGLSEPPATVLLIQGGVRLACEGSDCLDPLRTLVERGVTLLACGTCLDYFGLMGKLQVGTVSNMAEIVDWLMRAGRTIPV